MAYGVYYREKESKLNFCRCGEWVKSPRSRIGERVKDYRFETLDDAEKFEREFIEKHPTYETKIKQVK